MSRIASVGSAPKTATATVSPRPLIPISTTAAVARQSPTHTAGIACMDPFRHGDDRQNAEADEKRNRVRFVHVPGQDRDALEHWTVRRGQSEDVRQLGDEDVRREDRKKADRHRYRE